MGIGEIGELLRRSTVHIHSSNPRRQSSGSGILWDGNGTIITNAHVIGKGSYSVELWDGSTAPAKLESRDDQHDLAKLKVPLAGVQPVSIRESPVRPGEVVIAVGNPLGFSGALSTGVVQAVGTMPEVGYRNWVQAAIRLAPGNSGGPLADAAGKLVGINTMVVRGGIALAIPSSVAADFVSHGPAPRLGVAVRPVRFGERGGIALLVLSVEKGSPAEQASLLIGDLLIGANEARFASLDSLAESITEAPKGILKLRFLRGDRVREREVAILLQGRPDREAA